MEGDEEWHQASKLFSGYLCWSLSMHRKQKFKIINYCKFLTYCMTLTLVKKELPLEYQYSWKNHLVCQALVSLGSPALTEGSGLLPRVYLRISFYYLPVLKRKKEMKERKKKKKHLRVPSNLQPLCIYYFHNI